MSRLLLDNPSKKQCEAHLPDPRGPLSSKMLPSTIAAVNVKVMHVINASDHGSSKFKSTGKKRGVYNKYTPEFKAKIARYAIENSNCQAARKLSTTDKVIDKSSVRGWATTYNKEEESRQRSFYNTFASCSKTWSAITSGDTLDSEVKSYIRSVCEGGRLVTTEITMAAARAILESTVQD